LRLFTVTMRDEFESNEAATCVNNALVAVGIKAMEVPYDGHDVDVVRVVRMFHDRNIEVLVVGSNDVDIVKEAAAVCGFKFQNEVAC
jgi:hypothetical protein